jgi:HAD superfamily hydrolase (TIGR01662 family)
MKKEVSGEFIRKVVITLFSDLDGTLIETASGKTFPQGIWDMKFKTDVLDKIKELPIKNVAIVSNQGGISLGYVDQQHFYTKMTYIATAIEEYTKKHVIFDYCISNEPENPLRKPNPGMINNLIKIKLLRKEDCVMIGDASGLPGQFSNTDRKTAENAGIKYFDIGELDKLTIYLKDYDHKPY